MTRIVYVAPFEQDYGTEFHIVRDAEAIGCEVQMIRERTLIDAWDRSAAFTKAACNGADLLLYTKAHGLPPQAHVFWREIEAMGVQTASFTMDIYRGLAREREMLDDPFWRTGTVFSTDGDPDTTAELALLGIDHRWLPAACYSAEAVAVDNPSYPAPQIVFVGSTHSYHPEWPWRLTLLAALRRRYGVRFGTLGGDGAPIRGLDLNRLYQTPGRIVVGDSLALPGHRNYWSDRYYETIGRGGFLIAPRVPGLSAHFQNGSHFLGYDPGDIDGLYGLIDGYLDQPNLARSIAHAGQVHVAAHHTYRHRVARMLAEVGLPVPA